MQRNNFLSTFKGFLLKEQAKNSAKLREVSSQNIAFKC